MATALVARRRSLAEWLEHCERLHPWAIDMSLDRVKCVKERLALTLTGVCVVVAGTNGKGSNCAMLESIAVAAGLAVGVYSKPHLVSFEERCRIDGQPVSGTALVPHFEAVELARQDVSLTYFEFTTLAIAHCLASHALDLVVLEVGLGGERDAVNVFDADCALITGIDIDHVDYLGPDREAIGREKAGVMRTGRPTVVAEPRPPLSVLEHARKVDARLVLAGRDYEIRLSARGWTWAGRCYMHLDLPKPALIGSFQMRNAAGVLAVLDVLSDRLPLAPSAVRAGLEGARLAGRFQRIGNAPTVIVDVAHNPQSVAALFANLAALPATGSLRAVFGCMKDKAIEDILRIAAPHVDAWHFCELNTPRAASARALCGLLTSIGNSRAGRCVSTHASPSQALTAAQAAVEPADTIVVFGSFFTVGGVLQAHRACDRNG